MIKVVDGFAIFNTKGGLENNIAHDPLAFLIPFQCPIYEKNKNLEPILEGGGGGGEGLRQQKIQIKGDFRGSLFP